MLISDFKENFPEFLDNGNIREASLSVIKELGNILVNNKQDFVDLLNQSDIDASINDDDSKLINKYILELGENRNLHLGSALLVHVHNRESGFDGEQQISDDGVKNAYKVLCNYYQEDEYSNAIDPVTGIAEGVGKLAELGTTIAQGKQKRENAVMDLASKKAEARSQMAQKVLDLKIAQAQSKKDKSGSRTKTILIVGGVVLGLALIGTMIYLIKNKNK